MTRALGQLWVDGVLRAGKLRARLRLRPGFYSWLHNLAMGAGTPATPDGRLTGKALSADALPSAGRGDTPTALLRCMAALPQEYTWSGGTTLHLDPSHFSGAAGVRNLSALIETYFAAGGLQLHFVFADASKLRDAILHPDAHRELLVRVTGFSEYFVRLLPRLQEELVARARAG